MDDDIETTDDAGAPASDPPADPPASPAAHVQAVFDTPEYKALKDQNRSLARSAGQAKAAEEAARAEAARIRLVAEASEQAALEQQIVDILGEEGVTEWNAISELGETNPVEAAKRLKALMTTATAQSAAPVTPPAAAGAPAPGGNVDHPPAPRGVDADSPLTTQGTDEMATLISGLEKQYADTVKLNQDPSTRNRLTMKDRARALIGYVGASYLKAGAKPKQGS